MGKRRQSGGWGKQRGITLMGLLFWAVTIGFAAYVGLNVFPTVNEFLTIKKAVAKVAGQGLSTVPEIRNAFDKQKDIEYSIKSISGKDLDITKDNSGVVVISFAYNSEVVLMEPVFLLIKYAGSAKGSGGN